MMHSIAPKRFREAERRIASWRRPLLISHTKPDGDALGSIATMYCIFRSRGVEATVLLFDELPDRYALFREIAPMTRRTDHMREGEFEGIDGVLILDTCANAQLTPIEKWLHTTSAPKLVVDHHVSRDELADVYLVDESAAATCLILYEWARAAEWTLTRDALDALFVGMATDTGWFRHANTDGRVLAAAADLAARGVSPSVLFRALYQQDTAARVRLLSTALQSLELCADGRLALMSLPASAIRAAGAATADTEDIVNEPLRIGSVCVAVLFVEQDDGLIRVSLRSKPPAKEGGTAADVDVAAIAQSLGGGGHRRAAGVKIHSPLEAARDTVIARCAAALA